MSSLDEQQLQFCQQLSDKALASGQVVAFLDMRGLPCPMPLLKAKVALRSMVDGEALYLLASDVNAQTDLSAFCQKQHHSVQTWAGEGVCHFIIIKNGEK